MKEIVAVIFGLGLLGNALLFVPQIIAVWRKKSDEGISLITFGGFSTLQVIGIIHGIYQRDPSLIIGMAASLLTCGSVTGLTIFYRMRRLSASEVLKQELRRWPAPFHFAQGTPSGHLQHLSHCL